MRRRTSPLVALFLLVLPALPTGSASSGGCLLGVLQCDDEDPSFSEPCEGVGEGVSDSTGPVDDGHGGEKLTNACLSASEQAQDAPEQGAGKGDEAFEGGSRTLEDVAPEMETPANDSGPAEDSVPGPDAVDPPPEDLPADPPETRKDPLPGPPEGPEPTIAFRGTHLPRDAIERALFPATDASNTDPGSGAHARGLRAAPTQADAVSGAVGIAPLPVPTSVAIATMGLLALLIGFLFRYWTVITGTPSWPSYTRLEPAALARHPRRARLLSLMEAQPGLHFRALARQLGVGRGTAWHHLDKLVAGGLVTAQVANGRKSYFVRGSLDRRVISAVPFLKSTGARRLLREVLERPGASPTSLARRLALDPGTVSYHVKRLAAAGLLSAARGPTGIALRPTTIGSQALAAANP